MSGRNVQLRLPVVFSVAEAAKIISNIFSLMKKYTMIYTHVAQKKLAVVESPLDRLESLPAGGGAQGDQDLSCFRPCSRISGSGRLHGRHPPQ
jgi:hypothetical protein